MKLLLLTPQLPYPAHQGTTLRNYHIIRGLARDHTVSLLSYDEVLEDRALPEQLTRLTDTIETVPEPQRSTKRRLWQILSTCKPDMALRLYSEEFGAALQMVLRGTDFDIVQIEGIELAWTIPIIRQEAPRTAVVYDAHNAETLLQARSGAADRGSVRRWPAAAYSAVQSARLARYEGWTCREVAWVTAVSEKDGAALRALSGTAAANITVIPNSIDVSAYEPDAAAMEDARPFDIVFSGKMDYRPNVDAVLWFADEVWPLIKKENPDVTWAVVGQKPHARLSRLTSLSGVTVTGWVPDIKPYLAGASVFIMPFRVGSGTRLKLIEALAAGKAVVSTRVGVEGFPVADGEHLLLADTAVEFADRTTALLLDPQQRENLGRQGRLFAKNYDWRVVVPKFEAVYEHLAHLRGNVQ